jgi:hypothetical protein
LISALLRTASRAIQIMQPVSEVKKLEIQDRKRDTGETWF